MPPPVAPTIVGWRCFAIDEFPDIEDALRDRTAVEAARTLNVIARHVSPGAMTHMPGRNIYNTVLCIKY
jgi:hypothetical protein